MRKLKSPLQIPVLKHPDETFDSRDLTPKERFRLQYQISLQAWKLRGLPIPDPEKSRNVVRIFRRTPKA